MNEFDRTFDAARRPARATFRQLEIFEAVARNLSFTQAAEELNLSQPAVSLQMKQLESSLDVSLLQQNGRKISLSDAGQVALEHSRKILQQLCDMAAALEEVRVGERGRLRITVASTVNYFAARLVASFLREHPDIDVFLDVTNRETVIAQLHDQVPDIVLMGAPPKELELDAQPFMDNPLVVIAAIDHPLVGRESISLETLMGETLLLREQGSGTRIATERFFQTSGMTPRRIVQMRGNEAIKQSVEAGLGVAVLSRHVVDLELKANRLRTLAVDTFPIMRRWFLVRDPGRAPSLVAQRFCDHVLSQSQLSHQGAEAQRAVRD